MFVFISVKSQLIYNFNLIVMFVINNKKNLCNIVCRGTVFSFTQSVSILKNLIMIFFILIKYLYNILIFEMFSYLIVCFIFILMQTC